MSNENIVKKVCKELGIETKDIEKSPTLKKILDEYNELQTCKKLFHKLIGIDRAANVIKYEIQ